MRTATLRYQRRADATVNEIELDGGWLSTNAEGGLLSVHAEEEDFFIAADELSWARVTYSE